MSRELVRFGDISIDENENYLESFNSNNKEASIRKNETNLDSGLSLLEKEHSHLEIGLKRKREEKSKYLSTLVKSQQELVNVKSECDREKSKCGIEERKYSQSDENLKSIKEIFDGKQQTLKAFQADLKNFKLNEFTESHEISVGLKEANAEFRQTLKTMIGKTDENILKDLKAVRNALENELIKSEDDEEAMAIAEDQSMEFQEEHGDTCLKIELLKLIYKDEIKLNEDLIVAERKKVH